MGLGTLGLCGLWTQGTECRVRSPTLPWHHPFFRVPSSDLGWSRQAEPWHVHGTPKRVSVPPPQVPQLSLCLYSPCHAWPLSPGILPASRAPLGTLSLPCLWVDLIHAWLYMQTCAGGSSLKGGEGNGPTDRGSSGAWFVAVFCCC